MKKQTCCFTGHRKIPPNQKKQIIERSEQAIEELIEKGYRYFGAGGALGFDTIAAQIVLKLRKKYPHIRLILVLPCISQTANWKKQDKQVYEAIKQRADKVVYTSLEYYKGCMLKRNRHLVDNSSACICYLTNDSGGTAYTAKYAYSRGLSVINVAEQ